MVKYCSATVHMYFLNIPGFSEVQGIIAKVAYAKKKNKKDLAAYVYGRTLSVEQKREVAFSTGIKGND